MWVIYLEVVMVGSLTKCFCSWETGSWPAHLTKVGCYLPFPMSDMPE